MSKEVKHLIVKMEEVEKSIVDISKQRNEMKEEVRKLRSERASLMTDFVKNKEKVLSLQKRETDVYDSIRLLDKFEEEVKESVKQQKEHIVKKALELRKVKVKELSQERNKIKEELEKKRLDYMIEVEKTRNEFISKVHSELDDLNELIESHSNHRSDFVDLIPKEHDEFNSLTYRLYKLTGEYETDLHQARLKLQKALEGSKNNGR